MSPLPTPIDTLTGNLLAEHTLQFDAWNPGATQRAVGAAFQVGGKGINVSKMLRRLGVPGEALLFAGGGAGDECTAWLQRSGLAFRAFPSASETRRGFVVRQPGRVETTFLGPDAAPGAAAIAACADYLDSLPAGRVLAFCGSFPGADGPEFDPLYDALGRWAVRGTLVVDTYGPALVRLTALPVGLVKINTAEFLALPGTGENGGAIVPGKSPVRNWIVTDGPRAVRFRASGGASGSLNPPPVREVSPTGSGDVLLACVLHAWAGLRRPLREAIAYALPFAAANAAHEGVADFTLPG